jgi:hypothetical protein
VCDPEARTYLPLDAISLARIGIPPCSAPER